MLSRAIEAVVEVVEAAHPQFVRRIDDALAVKLDCAFDRAGDSQSRVSAARGDAWDARTTATEDAPEAGLLDGRDSAACEFRRVRLFHLHLPVGRRGFR